MTKKKKATPKSSPISSRTNNTSRQVRRQQCRSIAEYLIQHGRATTIELASMCNAIHPPRRIFELRECGWQIETHWRRDNDSLGRSHRVGSYVLKKSGVMP